MVTRDFFALFAAPNEIRKKSDGNESWHFHPTIRGRRRGAEKGDEPNTAMAALADSTPEKDG